MATLQELMAQREALERQIDQTKKQERGEAIEKVRALMAEYGLTVADLGNRSSGTKTKKAKSSGNKVAAKYRNASTGETWSGRGLQLRLRDVRVPRPHDAVDARHRLRAVGHRRDRAGAA